MAEITERVVLASAARTTTQTGGDIHTYGATQVEVTLDMTTVGTGSVTLSIQGFDVAKGAFVTLLASAAIVTDITTILRYGLGFPVVANASAAGVLPGVIRVVVTANNANSATYSVSSRLLTQ